MQTRNHTYEVQIERDGRWVMEAVHDGKTAAISMARAMAGSGDCDGTRVVEDRGAALKEKVIFEQEGRRREPVITISPIEQAPVCGKVSEFYGFEARTTAGRLLRHYLNHKGVSAFEMLHDYYNLRELERMEDLTNHAIQRVANIQARATRGKPLDRVDRLYTVFARLIKRAKQAPDVRRYVETIKSDGFSAAWRTIGESVAEKHCHFVRCVALASVMGGAGDWITKVQTLIALIDPAGDEAANHLLDEVIAEILDGADAITEILGSQRDLGRALLTLGQLATGRFSAGGRGLQGDVVKRLNKLLAEKRLPMTKRTLLGRVARGLRGIQPITKDGPAADRQIFKQLVKAVSGYGGLKGGPVISDAITRRGRMVLGKGPLDLPPEEAIAKIVAMLPTRAIRLGYLLDLGASEFTEKYRDAVLRALAKVVEELQTIHDLVPEAQSHHLVEAATELHQRLGLGALPAEVSDLIAKRLAKLTEAEPGAEVTELDPEEPPEEADAPSEAPTSDVATKRLAAGEYLFREGDQGDEAYLLDSGSIEIVIENGVGEVVLATVDRGAIVGEMALIDFEPRMASARAVQDATLFVIPSEVFRARMKEVAEIDRLIPMLLTRYVERLRTHVSYD